jgi:DNA-binding Xre family transcriptional regulator
MAAFKSNLKQLMLEKSVIVGHSLTQTEVSAQTGLSLPTISRWYQSSINKLEIETVSRLVNYFGCKFGDLVEYVED